jgi:phage host-nuclease inhibitor protein Gam
MQRKMRDLPDFEREYRRMRNEMEEHMTEIDGDAMIMATVAMQYAITSLRINNYSPRQIEDLVRILMKQPRLN